MERSLITVSPDLEHEVTLAYCERLWPEWHEAKYHMDRAGGHSAERNLQFGDIDGRMNHLLEELFAQTVQVVEGDA